jgi:peptide/nickel transport system permease protein
MNNPVPFAGKSESRWQWMQQWADLVHSLTRSRLAIVGLVMFAIIVLLAVSAPIIAPHDPTDQDLANTLMPPAWEAEGSADHLLGTDNFGRDTLSRLLYGANISLRASGFAALFALVVGVTIGIVAGYVGGLLGALLMRIVDVFLAFPLILIALALAAILGPSLQNLILVMGITGWMTYARVVRAAVLTLKNQEFIAAAVASGCSHWRIMSRHILPNIVAPALVLFTFGFAQFIILESGLSFLGLGVQPPDADLGSLVRENISGLG